MAGQHSTGVRPSAISQRSAPGKHAAPVRTFAGTEISVDGVSRDAMSASSLLGTSIPKGPLAATIGANHAINAYTLAASEAFAQQDVSSALASIAAIGKARALRAVARNAEGVAPTSTPLSVEGPRLLAHGRGPRVVVQGMIAGDVARAVATFDRYGYTVNRAMVPPRLDPMTHYSYWQISDAAILGQIPQESRESIAAAFERGVTIWGSVAEIGTHPTNAPHAGVSY